MGIIEAIVAVGTILSSIYGVYKLMAWQFRKTPEEKAEDIAQAIDKKHDEFKETGRPKWD